MATLSWTGRSCINAGPLYLKFTDVADVCDEAGKKIGEVFHLTNGYYFPKHRKDIAGDSCSTPDQAMRKVEDIERRFG